MADTDLYSRPALTYALIAICIAVFFLELGFGLINGSFGSSGFNIAVSNLFANFGFSLQNMIDGKIWTLFTSIFLHSGTEHLLFNMLALYFFGRVVEMKLGRKKFAIAFIAAAIVGNLSFMALSIASGSAAISVIGASGAIFGLMGAAMLVSPLEFVFYPYLIPIPLILVAVLYTVYNIGSFVLVILGLQESNVSFITHIGGLATGMVLGLKEEKSKRGFIILLLLLGMLLLIPFVWSIFQLLESFNYISLLSGLLK